MKTSQTIAELMAESQEYLSRYSEEDAAFRVASFDKIRTAAHAVADADEDRDLIETLMAMVELKIFRTQNDEDFRRLVGVISEGVSTGDIAVETISDVEVLTFAFTSEFFNASHVVEHYVESKEFMLLMRMMKSRFDQSRSLNPGLVLSLQRDLFQRLLHLYLYDMDLAEGKVIEDAGSEVLALLPLEIRAELSGMHQPVTEEQRSELDAFLATSLRHVNEGSGAVAVATQED